MIHHYNDPHEEHMKIYRRDGETHGLCYRCWCMSLMNDGIVTANCKDCREVAKRTGNKRKLRGGGE